MQEVPHESKTWEKAFPLLQYPHQMTDAVETTISDGDKYGSCHTKASSLLTDEDWDRHLSAKETQVTRKIDNAEASLDVQQLPSMTPSNTCQGLRSLQSSPNKKEDGVKQHSTPSSPSELRRLTRPEAVYDGKVIQEAKHFESELKEWVSFKRYGYSFCS